MYKSIYFEHATNFCDNLKMASDVIANYQRTSSQPYNYNIYIAKNGPGSMQITSSYMSNTCDMMPPGTCIIKLIKNQHLFQMY